VDTMSSGHLWQVRAEGFFPIWFPGNLCLTSFRKEGCEPRRSCGTAICPSCSLWTRDHVKAGIIMAGFKELEQGRSFLNEFTGRPSMYLNQAFFVAILMGFFFQPGQKQEALKFLRSVQLWALYISVVVQGAFPGSFLFFSVS